MKLTDAQAVEVGLTPEPGIYLNVPAADYFRWPYLSKSGLERFCISPAQHRALVDGVLSWGRSDSMLLGSALDVLWFDGLEAFKAIFACEPAKPPLKKNGQPYSNWMASTPGKAWARAQEAAGRQVLTKVLWRKAFAMLHRLHAHEGKDGHPSASELREQGTAQVSIVWRCPVTGLWLKGRPDLVDFARLICSDLKTTADHRPAGFSKSIGSFEYHWQLYLYMQGLAILTGQDNWEGRFVAVRNEPVHSVEIYTLEPSALEQARAEVTRRLFTYLDCLTNDRWPADSGHMRTIDLPAWRRGRGGP